MCRLSMNQGRTPVVQILSFGRWFSRHAALPIRCGLAGAREKYSRRGSDRLDEPNQAIPWHGCIPAEPVAVLPGKIIVPRIVIEGVTDRQDIDVGRREAVKMRGARTDP